MSIKSILIFVSGAAIGAGIATYVTGKIYQTRCDEEIESVKKIYQEESAHIRDIQKRRAEMAEIKSEEKAEEAAAYKKILKENGYNVNIIRTEEFIKNDDSSKSSKYNNYLENQSPTDDEEEDKIEEEILDMSKEYSERSKDGEPYVIDLEDFMNDKPDYDKVSLEWYSYDQVLCDEIGDVVNAEKTVGMTAIDLLNSEDAIVYVRNDNLGIDYEVSFRDMAFDLQIRSRLEK